MQAQAGSQPSTCPPQEDEGGGFLPLYLRLRPVRSTQGSISASKGLQFERAPQHLSPRCHVTPGDARQAVTRRLLRLDAARGLLAGRPSQLRLPVREDPVS